MSSTYPTLAQKAIPQLLVFPSTWECKQGFSAMMSTKSKSSNRLTKVLKVKAATSDDFQCAVSTVGPRINQLVQK